MEHFSDDASGSATADAMPRGTVTFLFTDIENSTLLWEAHPVRMADVIARHDELVLGIVRLHAGHVFSTGGDGFGVAFAGVRVAVSAAIAMQRALITEAWPAETPVRSRMGLHVGEANLRDRNYFGTTVNRAARLMSVAHGGQIVVSEPVERILTDSPLPDAGVIDLGLVRLRGLQGWERVFGVVAIDLPALFAPLRAERHHIGNLPPLPDALVGRQPEIEDIAALLLTRNLVTLTGTGGVGKTSLALAVSNHIGDKYADGAWWIDLSALPPDADVAPVMAGTLDVRVGADGSTARQLAAALADRRMLVVLDNCEHLLSSVRGLIGDLQPCCSGLTVLATSRRRLNVRGERSVPVKTLALGENGGPALDLLLERSGLAEQALDPERHAALVEICRTLDGLPLAIELAAARLRTMAPTDVLARLRDRFRLLTAGYSLGQGLEQTVQWSFDLSGDNARIVLARLSVFASSFTLDAAEQIAGDGLDEFDVADAVAALVEHSLVEFDGTRYVLLETTRQFARSRLKERDRTERIQTQWVLDELHAIAAALKGPEEAEAMHRLDYLWADLRVVFRRAMDADDVASAVDIAVVLAFEAFWRRTEALAWIIEAHRQLGDRDHPLRGDVMAAAGFALWTAGRPGEALELGECALALRPPGSPSRTRLAEWTTAALGLAWTGRLPEACDLARSTLEGVREDPYDRAFWAATLQLGNSMAGFDPLPSPDIEDALASSDALGNPTLKAYVRLAMATAFTESLPTRSATLVSEAAAFARAVSSTWLEHETIFTQLLIADAQRGSPRSGLGASIGLARDRLRLGWTLHAWLSLAPVAVNLLRAGASADAFLLAQAGAHSPAGHGGAGIFVLIGKLAAARLAPTETDDLLARAPHLLLPGLLAIAAAHLDLTSQT